MRERTEDLMKQVFENQHKFNTKFLISIGIDINNIPKDKLPNLMKDYVLHLIKESTEVLDTIKFKMHRKEDNEFIMSNTVEELIDCQKFLLGMFQILGVDYEEFIDQYWRKTAVVEQRYQQEHQLQNLKDLKNVVAIDLDGVLAVYPNHWLSYLNVMLIEDYSTLEEAKTNVDMLTYAKLKSKYRQSGEKRLIPANDNASKFLHTLKDNGYTIVILTSRPYKKYNRIFADTIEWLKDNDMPFDSIMFDEQKNMKILKEIPNLKFMVEDNIKFANSVAAVGHKCYLLHNDGYIPYKHKDVIHIQRFEDILTLEGIKNES